MGTRTINSRPALDRPGVAEYTGKSENTVKYWYLNRKRTGFPETCDTDSDGRQWFWQTEITAFWKRHQAAKEAALTTVDRSGDPGELVTAPQAAKILGLAHRDNLPNTLLDHPDDVEDLVSGRKRRRWRRSSLWAYADRRIADPAAGRPTGTGTGRESRHLHYDNDQRLAAAIELVTDATAAGRGTRGLGAQLARSLGIDERTAQRLISAAKKATGLPGGQ